MKKLICVTSLVFIVIPAKTFATQLCPPTTSVNLSNMKDICGSSWTDVFAVDLWVRLFIAMETPGNLIAPLVGFLKIVASYD
jgi:hypothetical protein